MSDEDTGRCQKCHSCVTVILSKACTTSQILRILVACAIVIRPQILIFDGTLHSMHQTIHDTILRRLCAKDEPWTVIFVSNDPALIPHVDRRALLH